MNAPFELTSPVSNAARPRVRRGGWSWGPVEGARLRALSLGGGVQSTTLALMAAHGQIGPMPDVAIFADVVDSEPAAVAEQIRFLASGNVLPFPVHRVSAGSLSLELLEASDGRAKAHGRPPFYVRQGSRRIGQLARQCTGDYKIGPLRREQRRLLGFKPRQRIPDAQVEVWIGISTDEVIRAGAAHDNWAVNRYPLLEQRMSRADCVAWLERHGYPVPVKSACTFCPYRADAEWRRMRDEDPASWAQACTIDAAVRRLHGPGSPRAKGEFFVHRSGVPLAEVDLSTAEERGQGMLMVCDAGCGL